MDSQISFEMGRSLEQKFTSLRIWDTPKKYSLEEMMYFQTWLTTYIFNRSWQGTAPSLPRLFMLSLKSKITFPTLASVRIIYSSLDGCHIQYIIVKKKKKKATTGNKSHKRLTQLRSLVKLILSLCTTVSQWKLCNWKGKTFSSKCFPYWHNLLLFIHAYHSREDLFSSEEPIYTGF